MPPTHDTARAASTVAALLRAAESVRLRQEQAMTGSGVTPQQAQVLMILNDATDGLPTLEIARRLPERSPGITRLVDRLVRDGLVRRVRDGADRRQILCLLEPEGRRVVAQLLPAAEEVNAATLAAFSHHDVGVLAHLLRRIRDASE
ncbi:MAG TPA: MarR family transcriptional regulator [Gemmatimonadales bacterium]|nr:MarR family transcriptional regulator [Gemmatimonadales bacterium]